MKIESLCKQYNGKKVLEDFSLELPDRGIVALMGPSGCGKTTLLSILSGILAPDSGSVEWGMESNTSDGGCSMVFQEDRLLPWINVLDNVEIVLEKEEQGKGIGSKLLMEMGLPDLEQERIHALSGGMQRRVSIVRALTYDKPVLLMDEPLKGLDAETKRKVMDVILTHAEGRLVILVTHSADEALYLADEIYVTDGPPLLVKRQITIPESQQERNKDPEFLKRYQELFIYPDSCFSI